MATKTIKREINTEKTTVKATAKTTKKAVNSFKLDEKNMVLTVTVPVEWNKSKTGLKFTQVETDVKGFKYLVANDTKGNTVKLFKTGFEYEPVVKETVKGVDLSKAKGVLSDDEQALLQLLLKKMSK